MEQSNPIRQSRSLWRLNDKARLAVGKEVPAILSEKELDATMTNIKKKAKTKHKTAANHPRRKYKRTEQMTA